MNSRFVSLLAAATSLAALTAVRGADSAAQLTIHTAIEVEFPTETGKVYQLQGSSNLVDWSSIGDPVFGVGRPVTQTFSTRSGANVVFQSYRLDVSAGPTDGFAPWSFSGVTLSLDDDGDDDVLRFQSETEGVDEGDDADRFTYVFSRVDLNTVTVELTYRGARREMLTCTFSAAGMGTWMREEFRNNRLKDRDVGAFRVLAPAGSGGTPPPSTPPGFTLDMPTELAGLAYLFQDDSTPDRLEFSAGGQGLEVGDDVDDDEPNRFTYSYTATGTNSARLVVTFKPGTYDEYELNFSAGARGSFVRQEFQKGQLKDVDRGSFSGVGTSTDNSGGTPPTNTGTRPEGTLRGLTYTLRLGESPEVLRFDSETNGLEVGDDDDDEEANTFTYTYRSTGAQTAELIVRFDTDKWDEYALNFTEGNSGTFIRREFDDDLLKDTDTGTFSGSRTP
ncbi:MAG: hypothetical protein J0M24_19435 [Verrucomicrobia bacterium]|nr:hypothetical protein [Verrucomicrobiota bacterium]